MGQLRIIIGATVAIVGCGAHNEPDMDTTLERNKRIAADFLERCWHQKDERAVDELVHEGYIQHNPKSVDGAASVKRSFAFISPRIQNLRSIAEGDLVVQHNDSKGWGDPTRWVSFDIFRITEGRIIEHWDVMQPFSATSASGHSMVDGFTAITDRDKTAANKKLVQGFLDDCIYGGNWGNMANYISTTNYVQHNPGVKDGPSGLNEALAEMERNGQAMSYTKTYRVIAEGNFVFVHSSGSFAGRPVVLADLMRVEGGRIVEHWDLIQDDVPADRSKNGHDMYAQVSR